jgi:flagellar basal body rod protein FlgG
MTTSAIAAASSGLLRAVEAIDRASRQVAQRSSGSQAGDPAEPIVDMIEAKHAFAANAATLRAVDDTNRQLLDILV